MYKASAPLLLVLALAGATSAMAQTAPAAAAAADEPKAVEQRTERLIHMDSGSRVEELRVGGETRRIDVETRSGVPGYQVKPDNANKLPETGGQSPGDAGRSSWRVLNF